ncbi:MAG: filamentous hemagglutinin N-terminal domain-containing protein, partial [Deltaproteobacteria bacterium]|nr:filamentous hemagglutinin N-terminal domain-containing protein [Deltaproteobacteria bacterium]
MSNPIKLRDLAFSLKQLLSLMLASALANPIFVLPAMAADPTAMDVISGTAPANEVGNTLTITPSDGAVINWGTGEVSDGFSIPIEQIVNFDFQQVGELSPASQTVFNQIVVPEVSNIHGMLLSNGSVYVINPAGIVFHGSAVVNVEGIIAGAAKTLTVDAWNTLHETGAGAFELIGDVTNMGTITAATEATLMGLHVLNDTAGSISVPAGLTMLVAGEKVIFNPGGGILISSPTLDAGSDPGAVATDDLEFDDDGLLPDDLHPVAGGAPGKPGIENKGDLGFVPSDPTPRTDTVKLAVGDVYTIAFRQMGSGSTAATHVVADAQGGAIDLRGTTNATEDVSIVTAGLFSTRGSVKGGKSVLLAANGSTLTVEAGSDLDDNALTLTAETVDINQTIDGTSLTVNGNATASGDLTATGDLTFNGDLTLDGLMSDYGGEEVAAQADLPLNQLVSSSGGRVDGSGFISKSTLGDLTVGGDQGVSVGGDLTTTGGQLTITSDLALDGDGVDQTVSATGGIVDAAGDVEKTEDGSLTISGDGDGVFVAGDLTTSNGDLLIESDLTLDGVPNDGNGPAAQDAPDPIDQVVSATGGIVDASGNVKKVTDGILVVSGDGAGVFVAGDLTTSNGDLRIVSDLTLDGEAEPLDVSAQADPSLDQTVSATGGVVDASGNVRKVTDGSLTIWGDGEGVSIEGDLTTSGGDLLIESDLALDGEHVDQTVSATGGIVDAAGDVAKTEDGSLTISGDGDGVFVAGDLTTSGGDLLIESDLTLDGSNEPAGDVAAQAPVEPLNQTVSATGGSVGASGNVKKVTGGSLTISGDGDGVFVAGDLTTSNGDLLIGSDLTLNGEAEAEPLIVSAQAGPSLDQTVSATGGIVDASGNVKKVTDGSLTIWGDGEGVSIEGDLTTSGGDLLIESDLALDGDGVDQTVSATGGIVDAAGDVAKTEDGSLTISGDGDGVFVAGDLTTSGGALRIQSDLTLDGSNESVVDVGAQAPVEPVNQTVSATGGSVDASGNVKKVTDGSLTISGSINGVSIEGDLTTSNGDLLIESDLALDGDGVDQTVSATGGIVDAAGNVAKTEDGSLTISGDGDGVFVAGDLTTSNGDLLIESDLTLDGEGEPEVDVAAQAPAEP